MYSISIHQHGFLRKKSTVTNLTCFADTISEAMNHRSQIDVIYTDFAKAFDMVSHTVLLQKLKDQFGFHQNLLSLMSSYLRDRSHQVEVRGHYSDKFMPTSGVPQGSNLGPLLFLMFIDDIAMILNKSKSQIKLFADDLKLYREIISLVDCSELQNDLIKLVFWSQDNNLSFNIEKCTTISYTRKQCPIQYRYNMQGMELARVAEVGDLGITFDSQLSFVKHIELICNKASKMYGFIVRNTRHFSNIRCLKILYISFVRSILEYGSQVWSPYYECHKYSIEKIQYRALRYLYFKETGTYDFYVSRDILLKRFALVTLEKRRQLSDLVYLFKVIRGNVDNPEFLERICFAVPTYITRNVNTFYCDIAYSNNYLNSPIYRMCSSYNLFQTDCDVFSVSVEQFRGIISSKL